jgi:hypothetical protein
MSDDFNPTDWITIAEAAGRGDHRRDQAKSGAGNSESEFENGISRKTCHTCRTCHNLP